MRIQIRRVDLPRSGVTDNCVLDIVDMQPGEYIAHIQVHTVINGFVCEEPHVIIAKHLDAEKDPAT